MTLEQITFNIGAFNDTNAGGNNYYAGIVFEVKSQSDNTFAAIYADASGSATIPQNGIDNISNSIGECNFYIGEGEFYIEVDGNKKNFKTKKDASAITTDSGASVQEYIDGQQFESIDAVKSYANLSALIGYRIQTKEYHAGTGYGGASYDVVTSSGVTPNDIGIIQGVADSGATIQLNESRPDIYQLGALPDLSNLLTITTYCANNSISINFDEIIKSKKTLADVHDSIRSGDDVEVICEGDSLTYGQDTSPSGVNTQINGAPQRRSTTPYPETMSEVIPDLFMWGGSPTVINRGYPGDTCELSFNRWQGTTSGDICIIMLGTNDANGYGSDTTPFELFKAEYSAIIVRRMIGGAAVVLISPPNIKDKTNNSRLSPYSLAVKELAIEFEIPCVDAMDLISINNEDIWTDGVHLTQRGYSDIGWNLSSLFVTTGVQDVSAGSKVTTQNKGILHTLQLSGDYRYGIIAQIKGQGLGTDTQRKAFLAVNLLSDCGASLDMASTSGTNRDLTVKRYYNDNEFVGDGPGGDNPSKVIFFGELNKGIRLLRIETTQPNDAFLNAVIFDEIQTITQYESFLLPSFSGLFKPSNLASGAFDVFSTRELYSNFSIEASLSNLNDTDWQGLYIAFDKYNKTTLPSGVLVVRKGTDRLLIRKITNGVNDGDLFDSGGVFPATGDWSGKIRVDRNATGWLFYVDGALQHTESVNLPAIKGYAGVRLQVSGATVGGIVVQDY